MPILGVYLNNKKLDIKNVISCLKHSGTGSLNSTTYFMYFKHNSRTLSRQSRYICWLSTRTPRNPDSCVCSVTHFPNCHCRPSVDQFSNNKGRVSPQLLQSALMRTVIIFRNIGTLCHRKNGHEFERTSHEKVTKTNISDFHSTLQ